MTQTLLNFVFNTYTYRIDYHRMKISENIDSFVVSCDIVLMSPFVDLQGIYTLEYSPVSLSRLGK